MASSPGETLDFNFGPERVYDPKLVAEQAIWPLVDSLWGGDWRNDSIDGFRFCLPKRGQIKNVIYDVQLEADYDEYDIDLEMHGVYAATLYVEELVQDQRRNFMMAVAKTSAERLNEADANYNDEDDDQPVEFIWPEGDETEFQVMDGVCYSFDTDDDWYLETYKSIKGPEQRLNIPICEAEADISAERKLRLYDLEAIETGCLILSAPAAIMKALAEIKANPKFL